ncbi:MAG: hypothetical protein FJ297_06985 [Planctomycetes bacterium]|nr:hypothetical protein [Planctomycetota bacterium]
MRNSLWFVLALIASFSAAGSVSTRPARAEDAARWYRGNLHTHSLWSDGNDFPEMICDWYVRNGYHFLGLSDHNILSRGEKWIGTEAAAKRGSIGGLERYRERFGADWVVTREQEGKTEVRLKTLEEFRPRFEKPGAFLLLEAEEITDHYQSYPIHVNANNVVEYVRPRGGDSIRATIANNLRAVEEQSRRAGRPILAHLNHPNFHYAVTAEDMAAVVEERFYEVYNGHPGVNHLGDATHASVERQWDIANTIRLARMNAPPLFGLATDDSHNYFGTRGASSGRGWVMVRAGKLEPDAILNAMFRGDFYASSGVALKDVAFDADHRKLAIAVDAEPGVEYVTEFIGTRAGHDTKVEPVRDADGKELNVTQRYSTDVGAVLARVAGPSAEYAMRGDELYVRAVVTASKEPANPSFEGQKQQAWTQPVGWRMPGAPR